MHFNFANNDREERHKSLIEFPFITHFGYEQYNSIRPNTLNIHYNEGIEICYILKGRYEWIVEGKNYLLYPGNGFITSPWEKHGSPKEIIDIGEIYWIIIKPEVIVKNGKFSLGRWSRFSNKENNYISKILSENTNHLISKTKILSVIFEKLYSELTKKPFGYRQNVYNLVESLLLEITRLKTEDDFVQEEKQKIVNDVEKMLLADLEKKWTVEELAKTFNLGVTSFTELMKIESGYTPTNFLIYLRLEKAKELIIKSDLSLSRIALNCGFYSSQHFSSTFQSGKDVHPQNLEKFITKIKNFITIFLKAYYYQQQSHPQITMLFLRRHCATQDICQCLLP